VLRIVVEEVVVVHYGEYVLGYGRSHLVTLEVVCGYGGMRWPASDA
jgi:hypothetical protein